MVHSVPAPQYANLTSNLVKDMRADQFDLLHIKTAMSICIQVFMSGHKFPFPLVNA